MNDIFYCRGWHGWVNLYKPKGISSNKALCKLRKIIGNKSVKVGHAGTLDPLAHGVLPIGIGHATRLIEYVVDCTKKYEFTMQFGVSTDTEDIEGNVTKTEVVDFDVSMLEVVSSKFTGSMNQVPPNFSAVKVNGKRAYALARAGVQFSLSSRPVTIKDIRLLWYDNDLKQARYFVECSRGTYVRSLSKDIADFLGVCATVIDITRISVGVFDSKSSISLSRFDSEKCDKENLYQHLLPLGLVMGRIPKVLVTESQRCDLSFGRKVQLSDDVKDGTACAVYKGILVAVGRVADSNVFFPNKIFESS
ncbi:tRNA pseudouridine(55) synthase TruB [Candidatus Sneabacter namystus]|uniref:tRNA pseudouridine(55) synthase TruB n=1 Tax=Candidatus Sneabacter namystus TaxID=2601646 RepID=UPI00155AF403|nr:tRNA pseudouridine(55) synthase TruB [Candidatus Sneabacter namystus]